MRIIDRKSLPMVISVILFAIAPANSASLNGNKLLEACTRDSSFTLGFVAGASDIISIAEENKLVERQTCLRNGVTYQQEADIVCQYLKTYPSFRDFPAATLVSMALSTAFPCSK